MEEVKKLEYSFKTKEDNFAAGDIVLWDGEKKVVADPNGFSLPVSGYTPIGVIVIPASHMDDGQARMMSLRYMSCDDPENGSIEPEMMVWGTITDISGFTNYLDVPVIAKYDNEVQGGITALTVPQEIYTKFYYAYLPSDNPSWTGETNPEDPGTRWKRSETYLSTSGTVDGYNYYAPSPYASDGTPNPLYRATSYSGGTINNALSYFDGRSQTNALLEARGEKDYGTWKPENKTTTDFPAASCCDIYHTVGTLQGDWYLPSQAELGYVVARVNAICKGLSKVVSIQKLTKIWLWTSSSRSNWLARSIHTYSGQVNGTSNRDTALNPVVAFATV